MDNKNNISISKNAAEKIKNIISSQEKDVILKISVLGGGCAGFSYQFDLVKSLDKFYLLFLIYFSLIFMLCLYQNTILNAYVNKCNKYTTCKKTRYF